MREYLKTWLELKTDKRAVTMMEYGLLAALIAVVCIAAVTNIGTSLDTKFQSVASSLG